VLYALSALSKSVLADLAEEAKLVLTAVALSLGP
jgi:hypothetical protein